MADAMHYPWSSTTRPRSIMDDLVEHKGKRVNLTLTTSGAQRVYGDLKEVYHDGVVVDTFGSTGVIHILARSIAIVEVMKNRE
jgi:isocitrate lyase